MTEQDIFRTLNFKLHRETVFEVAMKNLELFLINPVFERILPVFKKDEIREVLKMMIYMSVLKISFCSFPIEVVANSCILVSLRLIEGIYA